MAARRYRHRGAPIRRAGRPSRPLRAGGQARGCRVDWRSRGGWSCGWGGSLVVCCGTVRDGCRRAGIRELGMAHCRACRRQRDGTARARRGCLARGCRIRTYRSGQREPAGGGVHARRGQPRPGTRARPSDRIDVGKRGAGMVIGPHGLRASLREVVLLAVRTAGSTSTTTILITSTSPNSALTIGMTFQALRHGSHRKANSADRAPPRLDVIRFGTVIVAITVSSVAALLGQ